MDKKCPCNPSVLYRECCGRAHQNIQSVKTAEQLMRSRYSAFVLANGSYLQESYHSSTKPSQKDNKETIKWAKSVRWIRLEVLKASQGMENNSKGTVEFKAYFLEDGFVNFIHENSLFIKEKNVFRYVDRVS